MIKVRQAAELLQCSRQRIYLLAQLHPSKLKIHAGIVVSRNNVPLNEAQIIALKLPKAGRPKKK